MNKKSHISLAGYILRNMESEELSSHKKAFLLGSILPDCMPSFLTRRHTIDDTFVLLKKELNQLTKERSEGESMTAADCRRLGVITHYVADYFTFPHNGVFAGKIKDHVSYEAELMHTLDQYVNSMSLKTVRLQNGRFRSIDQICDFIKMMHTSYQKALTSKNADCRYIVELCFRVVDAVLQIFEMRFLNEK